jgi:hypothetical protein
MIQMIMFNNHNFNILAIFLYFYLTAISTVLFFSIQMLFGKNGSMFNTWMIISLGVMLAGAGTFLFNGYLCRTYGIYYSTVGFWFAACDLAFIFVLLMWSCEKPKLDEHPAASASGKKKETSKKEAPKKETKKNK